MDYTAVIQSKMAKVERSLEELNNEVLMATKYLLNLKENAAAFVGNLNNIITPSTYLEEFLTVNSFLMKSISFLSEFNCKFEILGITEKALGNLTSIKETQSPVVKTEIVDEPLNCDPTDELKPSVSKVLKSDIIEEKPKAASADEQKQKEGSKKKKKSKTSKSHKNKTSNNISCAKVTTTNTKGSTNVKKSNTVSVSADNTDNKGSPKTEANQRSNSDEPLKLDNSLSCSKGEKSVKNISTEETNTEVDSLSPIYLADTDKEKTKQISQDGCSISLAGGSSNNKSNNTLSSVTQPSGSIPVAEVVPTKIICKKLEDNFKKTQPSEEDFVSVSQPIINDDDDDDDDDEDELDGIKPADIERKLGEEYNVVVEYIKSPSEFYVSITDKETNLLIELENKLKEIPGRKNVSCNTRNELTKSMLKREIGSYCLVYSKCDEMWCRAKITNWCLNYDDKYVNIFLLDYGESKCVSIYDLQAIPKYLKQYPAFTVRCHLYNVFPVDMDNGSILSWGKESSEEMRSLIESNTSIRMRIAPGDSFHPKTSLPVTLWLGHQENKCVNELLVSSKFAIHGLGTQSTEIVDEDKSDEDLNDWNPMKEDYESYKNSYDLDVNDPSAIIYGYVGKDYDRICRHFAKTGHCYKGQACRKEHKQLDHLGFTTDQEEVFQGAINKLSVPPPNSKVNIQVTCLLTCNKFFCFMEKQKSSPEEEDLHSLLKFMNKKENLLEMKKLLIPPSAGQIVLACYSEDGCWYRARVLESQPENDQYTVLYVDYGNSEKLQLSDIRAIEARYLHLPFQAMQCSIIGIERNPEVPEDKIMDYMKQIINEGYLSIEVISRLPGDNINLLVNVFDQKGQSIGMDLIAKKYAIFKDEMIINTASESIPG